MGEQRVSVCQVSDLSVGEMRQFSVVNKSVSNKSDADQKVLLVRTETGFNAVAPALLSLRCTPSKRAYSIMGVSSAPGTMPASAQPPALS